MLDIDARRGDRTIDRPVIYLIAALISLRIVAVLSVGVIIPPDGGGYIGFADYMLDDFDGWFAGDFLDADNVFHALHLRIFGYPALIALAKLVGGEYWAAWLIGVQLLFALAAHIALFQLFRRFFEGLFLPVLLLTLYSLSITFLLDISVLTDSIHASLFTILIALLVKPGVRLDARTAIGCGGILLALVLLRETTLYLLAPLFPLLLIALFRAPPVNLARSALLLVLTLGPVLAGAQTIKAWNEGRLGAAVMTTSGATGFLYVLVLADKAGAPVFESNDTLGRYMRETRRSGTFDDVWPAIEHVRAKDGLRYVDVAADMRDRYFTAWRTHPAEMARAIPGVVSPRPLLDLFNPLHTAYLISLWTTGDPLGPFTRESFSRLLSGTAMAEDVIWFIAHLPFRLLNMAIVFGGLGYGVWIVVKIITARRQPGQAHIFPIGLWLLYWGCYTVFLLTFNMSLRYIIPTAAGVLMTGAMTLNALADAVKKRRP